MNSALYYGGFGLAITLFLTAAALFFIFRIPTVVRYLQKTNRKGLVEAADVEIKNVQQIQTRKSQAFDDADVPTEHLSEARATEILNENRTAMLSEPETTKNEQTDATEILS